MASSPALAIPHFSPNATSAILDHLAESPRLARVTAASHLEIRPAPDTVSSGIVPLDALTGGLPRGSLTEITGPDSSGRTSILLAALAAATQRGEICALIDATDSFHPQSAAAAGIDLARLLWVRCTSAAASSQNNSASSGNPRPRVNSAPTSRAHHASSTRAAQSSRSIPTREPRPARQLRESRDGYVSVQTHIPTDAQRVHTFLQPASNSRTRSTLAANLASAQPDLFSQEDPLTQWKKRRQMEDPVEQALRATDLLLQSGGFGLVVIDLAGVPVKTARRVPLTTWFRFRRVIEATPTVLLLIGEQPCAQTCASLRLRMSAEEPTSVFGSNASSVVDRGPLTRSGSLMRSSQLSVVNPQPSASFSEAALVIPFPVETVHSKLAAQGSKPAAPLAHTNLLQGLPLRVELQRATERKPTQSMTNFQTRAAWTGA